MDYTTGWDDNLDIGSADTAFTKDYLNKTVWNKPVNFITIIRHQRACIRVFSISRSAAPFKTNLKIQASLDLELILAFY